MQSRKISAPFANQTTTGEFPRVDIYVISDAAYSAVSKDANTGLPLIDPQTRLGLQSPVSVKRKIRDVIDARFNGVGSTPNGHNIYIKNGAVLNEAHAEAYTALGCSVAIEANQPEEPEPTGDNGNGNENSGKSTAETEGDDGNGKKKGKKGKKGATRTKVSMIDKGRLIAYMCEKYWDVRVFGAMMETSIRCGRVTGPVQVGYGRSIEPVRIQHQQVSRCAVTTTEDAENDKESTFGDAPIIPYAMYVLPLFINSDFARKTGFSRTDMEELVDALRCCFDTTQSTSRPECSTLRVVIFEHEKPTGCAHTHMLRDLIKIKRVTDAGVPARSHKDFQIEVDYASIPEGVRVRDIDNLTGVEHVESRWTTDNAQ